MNENIVTELNLQAGGKRIRKQTRNLDANYTCQGTDNLNDSTDLILDGQGRILRANNTNQSHLLCRLVIANQALRGGRTCASHRRYKSEQQGSSQAMGRS